MNKTKTKAKSHVGRPRRDGQAPIDKEKIMITAGRLFGAKGYGVASIRMICNELNATPSSIFHHFPTKQKILEEIFSFIVQSALEFYDRVAETGAPAAVQLYRIVTVDYQLVSEVDPELRKVLGLPQVRDPEFKVLFEERQRTFKHIEMLLKKGEEEGDFRSLDFSLMTEVIGLVSELPVYTARKRRNKKKDAKNLADFLFRGLMKDPQQLDDLVAAVNDLQIRMPTSSSS